MKGKTTNFDVKRFLASKTIADVAEAIIGAAFVQQNKPGIFAESNWDQAVQAVSKFVSSEEHALSAYTDYHDNYVPPQYLSKKATAAQAELARQVEGVHLFHFTNPALLRSAFIHPSNPFMWEQTPNYERLEFLGDALLDLVCVTYLYYKFPDKDPQWLTEHKSAMVSNRFLGALSVKIGFFRHLIHCSQPVGRNVSIYVAEVEEVERAAKGQPDYWITARNPPKV